MLCYLRAALLSVKLPFMKVGYAKPAEGELYLVRKSVARRVARDIFPDLKSLLFQTVHGVRRSEDFPYVANFFWGHSVRILSIREEFFSENLAIQFGNIVLPYIFNTAKYYQECGFRWPVVIVGVNEGLYQVSCSAGFQFPNHEEVMKKVKKQREPICKYKPNV